MDFKNIPKKYRPIPFWSWNDKLEVPETTWQIEKMDEVGIGGFFMHARGGLKTEYMGEEWFQNVDASINKAEELGMYPWAYDENGWPSGFGNSVVTGMGLEYHQKYIRMSDKKPEKNVIGKSGEHWFYFDVNPYYVDTMNKKAIKEFIEVAYKPYYERYGNRLTGFFTDEPQISRDGIPWSFLIEDEYKKKYGEDILEHLEELFLPIRDYKDTRVKFWKLVTDLFSDAFLKQVYEKCHEWGYKLTGHMVLEESLIEQLTPNGACMPNFEYFDYPGMDWLGRPVFNCLTPMQVSSVAEQLGKEFVMAETFGLCGHNVSFAELKGIYEWQMVHGINLLCQHLEGYSIRGQRKRDYPPAMYIQQPWWSQYGKLIDALSRIGMVLADGKKTAKVLVIHPQTTAWTLFDNDKNEGLDELNSQILDVMARLEGKHIAYHLGDETIMERHAKVENGEIVIGMQRYDTVITPVGDTLFKNTERLLKEFLKSGGKILDVEDLADNPVTDRCDITYLRREFDDFVAHYFVNSSDERKVAKINVAGRALNIYSGELEEFSADYEFEPWGSLMVIDDGEDYKKTAQESITIIRPDGEFKIAKRPENMMTLDMCDYYFDGELQEENGYVLNISERANQLERAVKIHQDYFVTIEDVPEKLYLVVENPENFKIFVNDNEILKVEEGYVIDKNFRKISIEKYLKKGENKISFDCDFRQSDTLYENLKKAKVFEGEKNKLVYDIEIEPIYLLGDFAVKTDGRWKNLPMRAERYFGDFKISAPIERVNLKNIERQGYPFFAGEMVLEGELEIFGENPVLDLEMKGVNAVKVEILGTEKVMLTDNRLPLGDFGVTGTVKVKITLINNLRNLMGPHHLPEGEATWVEPASFFKEPCVWSPNPKWDDNYCFVEMSI